MLVASRYNGGMRREPDPNVNAVRIVQQTASQIDDLPPDLEAAWRDWSGRVQKTDERTLTLLKAAFEAGAAAAKVLHGRAGGLKGGAARAAMLTKKRKSEIAKTAAAKRWGHPVKT